MALVTRDVRVLRRLGAVGAVAMLGALTASSACSKDDGAGGAGGGPTCAPTDPTCPALSPECLALTDHAGADQFALRLSQLTIVQPAALAQPFIAGIIGDGVFINLPQCNVSGEGTFSWLLYFDFAAGTLITGGALPKSDPTSGYCFMQEVASGIGPVEVPITVDASGGFETTTALPSLVVPIFLDITATSRVLLPLHELNLSNAVVSANHNCIGSFNAAGLRPIDNCKPNPDMDIDYYVNGGHLEGYITLEEADTVDVDLLGKSLCVLLGANDNLYSDGGSPAKCTRDGNGDIVLKGDWCSVTNTAGGCQDAMVLAADFAASAVELEGGCLAGLP